MSSAQTNKIFSYFLKLKKNNALGPSYFLLTQDSDLVKKLITSLSCSNQSGPCQSCWDCKSIDRGQHPDVCEVKPEPLTIKIESIRQAQETLSLKSFRLARKIIWVRQANLLSQEAANAFLKTLEEPPKNSLIFLSASSQENILPTILSRCRRVFLADDFKPLDEKEIEKVKQFCNGQEVSFSGRDNFARFLEAFIFMVRETMVKNLLGQKWLLAPADYEIIIPLKSFEQASRVLDELFVLYSAHKSVNEYLALQRLSGCYHSA